VAQRDNCEIKCKNCFSCDKAKSATEPAVCKTCNGKYYGDKCEKFCPGRIVKNKCIQQEMTEERKKAIFDKSGEEVKVFNRGSLKRVENKHKYLQVTDDGEEIITPKEEVIPGKQRILKESEKYKNIKGEEQSKKGIFGIIGNEAADFDKKTLKYVPKHKSLQVED